jgi:protein-disulfide isomerase
VPRRRPRYPLAALGACTAAALACAAGAPAARAPEGLRPAARAALATAGAPARGPADAAVTLVVFADFRCPYCRQMLPVLERLLAAHPQELRLVFKNLPVVSPDSGRAAIAALAAGRQGRFWEMHDRLFALQGAPLEERLVLREAQQLGLDVELLRADLRRPELRAAVEADRAEAERLGVSGTPAFFVNGVHLAGAQSFEALERAVEAAREEARRARH